MFGPAPGRVTDPRRTPLLCARFSRVGDALLEQGSLQPQDQVVQREDELRWHREHVYRVLSFLVSDVGTRLDEVLDRILRPSTPQPSGDR